MMSPLTKPAENPSLFTRRDFLKLGSLGLAGFTLPPMSRFRELAPDLQGRVIVDKVQVFDAPSNRGQKGRWYWKDMLFPILEVTASADPEAHNRFWYRIGEHEYVYSGFVQPVRTIINQPSSEIPPQGCLGEVTVPFTDAHWAPGKIQRVAYRYYYATTHWVAGLGQDEGGAPWYHIRDDKWPLNFYVPAQHLRLIPASELTTLSAQVPPAEKRLEIRLEEQVMVAYESKKPVFMARIASGGKFKDGDYSTQPGRYLTYHKRPSRHMAAGDLASNGYDLPGVPWVTYFTEEGVAFHGTYWHNDFGAPRSHGCINLTPQAAKWVYRWTLPAVPAHEQRVLETYGTLVDVV
jgi:lipoprotein-anchoring transpeptidase ErfK/SrfK